MFVPRPNVESALVEIDRRTPPATDPDAAFALVRAGFGQRRKMLRRSLAGVVDARDIRGGRREPDRPAGGARRRRLVPPDRRHRAAVPRSDSASWSGPLTIRTLRAHAKLTLSLRIIGVRDDGFHLIDAEMVTLDLHDVLTIDPDGDGLSGRPDRSSPAWRRPIESRRPRAAPARRQPHTSTSTSTFPHGGGLGGGRATPQPCCDGRGRHAHPELDDAARLGADIAFCLVGGRARVRGIGELVEPLPHVDRS